MSLRIAIPVLWSLVAGLALAPQGLAQGRHGPGARPARAPGPGPDSRVSPRILDRLNGMSAEQRQRLLNDLPPGRKEQVEKRLEEYKKLSPEERRKLQDQFEQFQQLPPERQQAARRLFKRFSKLPEDRRKAVQEEFENLRGLDEAGRAARLDSDEFHDKFNKSERQIIGDFAGQLLSNDD